MFINKIGSEHVTYGKNNQDFGFEWQGFLCVVDGCSEGEHSEVGAKLFSKKLLEVIKDRKMIKPRDIDIAFLGVKNFVARRGDVNYDDYLHDVINYMCFTIMVLIERERSWELIMCGDGVVITQDHDDNMKFLSIDHSSTPMYYAYSFVDREYLSLAEDVEVGFKKIVYAKDEYKAIGIASDGLEKIIGTEHEEYFKILMKDRKEWAIRRKINQLHSIFKDDITIAIGDDVP